MYLICIEPSYTHVYTHSCAHITWHVQFQLSCRAERRIDQACTGNCSMLQPKMFQELPHWNKLVQWQSALSLQYHTSTVEWKYELLFVVTFVKLHLTIGSCFSCAYIMLSMHLGSLRALQQLALFPAIASSYSYASFVLSKLPACTHKSIYAH